MPHNVLLGYSIIRSDRIFSKMWGNDVFKYLEMTGGMPDCPGR